MFKIGIRNVPNRYLSFRGGQVFSTLGVPTPAWYGQVAENKMMTFGAVWFANNMAAQLVNTGAFEIYVDGELAYSKLETGHLPSGMDIIASLAKLGLEQSPASVSAASVGDEF